MSSGVTASAKDSGPTSHMNGDMSKPAALSTDTSPTSNTPSDDLETAISPTAAQPLPRTTIPKQRSTSTSHATNLKSIQLNGTRRTQRSASANPRDFGRPAAPRKTLEPPSTSSRLQNKPSFQDIIKRFNDQPDESLPVPKPRSESISSSRCASPIRSKSSLATHHPPTKPASAAKATPTRSTVKTTSKPHPNLSKAGRDRRNSGSSTSSQQRGRRTSARSATDSSVRSATPADSIGTAPSDTESKPTGRKSSIPKPKPVASAAAAENSTPPLSPISPVESGKRSRLPATSTGRSTSSSTTTPGSRSSLPKPINTRTSSNGKTGPAKSPSLNAYIKAPESQKSPALRSSRPRLPVTTAKNAPSARPGMTESSSLGTSRMNGRATRTAAPAAKDDGKQKKKIPELGTIDFAARRKMIASAFNDRMEKEREERNRAHQKKEREAAVKKKQQEVEAKKAAIAEATKLDEDISPTSQPIGLGLDFGDTATTSEPSQINETVPVPEPVSDSKLAESVDKSPINDRNSQITQNAQPIENGNSSQIPLQGSSERPLSAAGPSPRSPKIPQKPEPYKRLSAASIPAPHDGSTTSSRPSSRQMFTEGEDRIAAIPTVSPPITEVHVSHETPSESPRVHPKLLIPGNAPPPEDHALAVPDTFHDTLLFRRSLSPIQGSPSVRSEDWEKAVEDEKRRRKEIEQDRELKLKNRLSTPVTPKNGSPLLDNDATPRGYTHKKQASWSASPRLAPPDSLGQIMWKYRPLSTSGESMIDTFYKEQEELSLARRRKQELMRFVEPESPAEYEDPAEAKGKAVNRYELHDKEYTLEAEAGENEAAGYVHIEGTYRYSASTVNSSVRSRSVDPNDYWTPQPSIGEFEGNPPRESWATDSTMTSYSTSSGLAPNGSFSRKIMDRERPISDTPPTPPPKDFVFSPKHASSTRSVASDAMPPPPPKTIASRRASLSSENVEPLRIVKPPILQHQEVYESPISINSANSLHPETHDDVRDNSDHSPSSEYSDEAPSDQSSQARGSAVLVYPETSPNTSVITNTGSFVSAQDPTPAESQALEKKMLTKRRFLLRELIDTEKTFFQDMTVTEEIYKGTADACDDLKAEDVRVLFGNTHAVVAFSRGFFDTLKAAAAPVYIPTKQPKTPSGSQIDINEANGETEPEVTQEADFQTWIGDAFAQALPNLERVFGDYCKNHEAAVSKLQSLEKIRGVAIWLKECKVVADDLTHAWSLESLLIKPVQRLLKYPLLLDQILDCTPTDHPDRQAIELVNKEVRFVTERINESKKRKDLMDKLVGPRRKTDKDLRHGLTKGWQRRAEKLRVTVGLSELPVDTRYETATTKFKEQYFRIQVIIRDIEVYLNDVEKQVNDFSTLAIRFEEFAACSPTRFKEYEERWQNFTKRMKEVKDVALMDHRIRVKRHVLTPLETVFKMCENPTKVMLKREKKAVDFARYLAMKEKGDKIDKKTQELVDAYNAVNDTLLDELPKLQRLSEKLLDVVLANFAQLCGVWDKYWANRLEGLLDPLDIPSNFSDIIEVYKSDFTKVESVVESLTITNTNANMWRTYSIYSASSSSSNPETASVSSHSLYRSPTAEGVAPSPNPSTFGRNSLGGSTPSRHSGSFSPGSALVAASIGHALPILPGAMASAQAAHRGRAASAFNIPPTRAPPPPPIRALSSANLSSHSPGISPTLSTHSVAQSTSSAPQTHTLTAFHSVDSSSPTPSRPSTSDATGRTINGYPVLWLCASIYAYHASKEADAKRDMGFAYLTYDQGEIFDVVGQKGEYWLARNQDDNGQEFGWIWSKHFARLALD